jgi:hypothetical protein
MIHEDRTSPSLYLQRLTEAQLDDLVTKWTAHKEKRRQKRQDERERVEMFEKEKIGSIFQPAPERPPEEQPVTLQGEAEEVTGTPGSGLHHQEHRRSGEGFASDRHAVQEEADEGDLTDNPTATTDPSSLLHG